MSNSGNTPCTNPTLCGVKTHRPGTLAKCQQTSASKSGPASSNLTSTPKLATSGAPAPTIELSPEGEALLENAHKGETQEVKIKEEHGTQMILAVNSYGDKGSLFASSDVAVHARIKTALGVEVFAYDYGAQGEFTFRDGRTRKSWVHPCDENGEDISGQISSADYDLLDQTDTIANDCGYRDNFDPDGELSATDLDREVIRRVLSHTNK